MVTITSVFNTLRPCLACGAEFYPPRRPDRLIMDYCSAPCERRAGLRPMKRHVVEAPTCQERRRPGRGNKSGVPHRGPRRMVRSAFAQRMIEHRLKAGLTQADLAQRIGAVTNSVRNWERDKFDPAPRYLAAMADLFGITMDELWRGDSQAARGAGGPIDIRRGTG